MALEPLFSLTPSNPEVFTWDPANPDAPYVRAGIYAYGVFARAYEPYRLTDQCSNDEILLGPIPADPTEQSIDSWIDDVYSHSGILISLWGGNIKDENQYLLVFGIRGLFTSACSAQFFVNFDLVHTQELPLDEFSLQEQVAILCAYPGVGINTNVYMRLASTASFTAMAFSGMDCYLI